MTGKRFLNRKSAMAGTALGLAMTLSIFQAQARFINQLSVTPLQAKEYSFIDGQGSFLFLAGNTSLMAEGNLSIARLKSGQIVIPKYENNITLMDDVLPVGAREAGQESKNYGPDNYGLNYVSTHLDAAGGPVILNEEGEEQQNGGAAQSKLEDKDRPFLYQPLAIEKDAQSAMKEIAEKNGVDIFAIHQDIKQETKLLTSDGPNFDTASSRELYEVPAFSPDLSFRANERPLVIQALNWLMESVENGKIFIYSGLILLVFSGFKALVKLSVSGR